MKPFFKLLILQVVIFMLFGCSVVKVQPTNTANYVEESTLVPIEIGSSESEVIGQCVNKINNRGFAEYGLCSGDFRGFYSDIDSNPADVHDRGLFQVSAKLGYKKYSMGGEHGYYTEYQMVEKSVIQPKAIVSADDLDLLTESCKGSQDRRISGGVISGVYKGCSVTERVTDVSQFEAASLKDFFQAGVYKETLKVVGGPVGFQLERKGSNSASCESPRVIGVHITPISTICARVDTLEIANLRVRNRALDKENNSLIVVNKELRREIDDNDKNLKSIESKLLASKTSVENLMKKSKKDQATANGLIKEVVAQNKNHEKIYLKLMSEKESLDEKLGKKEAELVASKTSVENLMGKYKKDQAAAKSSINEAVAQNGKYEKMLSKLMGNKKSLEGKVAKMDKAHKKFSSKLKKKDDEVKNVTLLLDEANMIISKNEKKLSGL